jgi:hypothetical protein
MSDTSQYAYPTPASTGEGGATASPPKPSDKPAPSGSDFWNWLGQAKNYLEDIPGLGALVAGPSSIYDFATGNWKGGLNQIARTIPGVGIAEDISGAAGGPSNVAQIAGDFMNAIGSIGGGGGGKKAPPPPAGAKPTATQPQGINPNDALTMGLQMFFTKYLMPQMAAINQSNMATIGDWQQMMNQSANLPLPPGVANIVKQDTPMISSLMGGLNTAAFDAASNAGSYQNFLQSIGANTAAQQAAQQAFTHAATLQALQTNPGLLSQVITQNVGGANTMTGGLLQALGSGGIAGLNTPPTGTTTPATTGTTTPSAGATNAAQAQQNAQAGSSTQTLLNNLVQQYSSNPQQLAALLQTVIAGGVSGG